MMNHEDLGMMQVVEVYADNSDRRLPGDFFHPTYSSYRRKPV